MRIDLCLNVIGTKRSKEQIAAVSSQMEIASNVTSIRRSSNTDAHPSPLPLHMEQIVRRRAYELYEQRGREDGHAQEDWMRAEAEVVGTALEECKSRIVRDALDNRVRRQNRMMAIGFCSKVQESIRRVACAIAPVRRRPLAVPDELIGERL